MSLHGGNTNNEREVNALHILNKLHVKLNRVPRYLTIVLRLLTATSDNSHVQRVQARFGANPAL